MTIYRLNEPKRRRRYERRNALQRLVDARAYRLQLDAHNARCEFLGIEPAKRARTNPELTWFILKRGLFRKYWANSLD